MSQNLLQHTFAAPGAGYRTAQIALIIEDDPQFSNVLAAHLAQVGYRPLQCERGRDAIMACALRPALITLDILLPDLDGWSVLSEIKRAPHMQQVPVLVVSVLSAAELGPDVGATAFMHKPAGRAELIHALELLVPEPSSPTRVLHVDDDPIMCELVDALLPAPRFQVQAAAGAREAAALLNKQKPHVVLLDLVMPHVSGFEFLQMLRADPRTCHLPVLVLTAKYLSPQEQNDLSQAAQLVLTKSDFTSQRLEEKLHHLERATSLVGIVNPAGASQVLPLHDLDVSQFRDDFLREGRECLEALRAVSEQQAHASDAAAVESALRAAHTLKGSSGMMGRLELSELAARAEILMKKVKAGMPGIERERRTELRSLLGEIEQVLDQV